jgi:hypothetical protein
VRPPPLNPPLITCDGRFYQPFYKTKITLDTS